MSNADSLIKLAELAASRHDQRRQYEWKVSFAYWALLIGAIKIKDRLDFEHLWAIGIVAILVYAFVWLRGLWVANANDKNLSEYFWKKAGEDLLSKDLRSGEFPFMIPKVNCKYWTGFLSDWAMQFHMLVTIAIMILFIVI